MYAVIRTGGKQQRVKPGDVIEVEFMKLDPGSAVEFQPILVVDDEGHAHVGKQLGKAKVLATLLGDKKADKVKVFKYQPKTGYRRTMGHRQTMTVLEVQEVALSPSQVSRMEKKEEPAPAGKKATAKKPAAKKPAAKKAAAKKPAAAEKRATAEKPAAKTADEEEPATEEPAEDAEAAAEEPSEEGSES